MIHLSRAAQRFACCYAFRFSHCVRSVQCCHRALHGSIHSRSSFHSAVQGVECCRRAPRVAARQAQLRRFPIGIRAVQLGVFCFDRQPLEYSSRNPRWHSRRCNRARRTRRQPDLHCRDEFAVVPMRSFAMYCANCKSTCCPIRPLTSDRSSRSFASISTSSPRATLMFARQVSRFTRSTRQTRARFDSLCVASRTAKCAKQSRRRLRS